ncbi:hypothetical protein EYZ11_007670 [Aspergillus tanneri]|uniref:Uncharacterized protein n=1 Tax=Aspergillus tanneri TaxID=1220188 RepID=A0A4S3JEM6_9EURO|nr:hypothetical protein EYZ11_007670 [Aspergillus tanneri]
MRMTVSLYHDQFNSAHLTDAMNLLAIEPLGHGATSSPLTIKGVLGSVAHSHALLRKLDERVSAPDFVIDDVWCVMVGGIGFGAAATTESSGYWTRILKDVYKGDEGRRKARNITCPVYWLQGTEDMPFGTTVPKEQIQLFTSSKEAKLTMIEGQPVGRSDSPSPSPPTSHAQLSRGKIFRNATWGNPDKSIWWILWIIWQTWGVESHVKDASLQAIRSQKKSISDGTITKPAKEKTK